MRGRSIILGAMVAAVAIGGCGSSSTQTKTVIVSTSTVTASAPTTSSVTTQASVTSASSSASPAGSTPILITNGWSGVKPSSIDFSGDGGNVVTGLSWTSWTATGATGDGTSGIQSCVPNCAQGATKQVPTMIVLSDPVAGHWTHLVETRNGSSTVDSYSSQATWPLGAQG